MAQAPAPGRASEWPFNGIGALNMSLGAIVMLKALLLGRKRYVGDGEYDLQEGTSCF